MERHLSEWIFKMEKWDDKSGVKEEKQCDAVIERLQSSQT